MAHSLREEFQELIPQENIMSATMFMLMFHMEGALRGAAAYVISSGVREEERVSRLADFIKSYLWPKGDLESLEYLTDDFRQDVLGALAERNTRPPYIPQIPGRSEEAKQSFEAEMARDLMRFEADKLVLATLERVIKEYTG